MIIRVAIFAEMAVTDGDFQRFLKAIDALSHAQLVTLDAEIQK
jgi:hypothetical protein